MGWASEDLRLIEAAEELLIGAAGRWTPIWVVCAGEHVYVRSWYRRDTGWFGRALRSGRAGIRVPGLEAAVTVEDVGAGSEEVRAAVDAAYRRKYRQGAESMVTAEAAATTLRLERSAPTVAE